VSESFVATHLIDGLRKSLPKEELSRLEPYEGRAATLGSEPAQERRRAFECARWAADVVADPARSAFVRFAEKALEAVKEAVKAVDAEVGADLDHVVATVFRTPQLDGAPGEAPELAWVVEAVTVAQRVAEDAGWAAVPWERLLETVCAPSP
jgi:hypothetical protein